MRKPKATKTLARKLRAIRLWKGLSQGKILRIVLPEAEAAHRALISQWENAKREPSRQALIRYKQFAGITFEELLLDEMDLPAHIQRFAYSYDGDIRKKRSERSTNRATEKGSHPSAGL